MDKYSIQIVSAERVTVQEDNSTVLSVLFNILNGEEIEATLRHGFSQDIAEKELSAELKKVLDSYVSDRQQYDRTAKVAKQNEQTDELISKITGKQIK